MLWFVAKQRPYAYDGTRHFVGRRGMNSFAVKGIRFGEGRPKTIVSLMDAEKGALLATARRAAEAGADCLEWRADFARNVRDTSALAAQALELGTAFPHTPLIFTFRSSGQGGQMELPVQEYAELVRAVAATGAVDFVDVELGVGDDLVRELVGVVHEHGARAIVSHHDFAGTPDVAQMTSTLCYMAALGADVPKLAVMATNNVDCLHLMEATARASAELDTPLVTMAMGKAGVLSRLAGESVGSVATFCALDAPSAPGQVSLARVTQLLDLLRHGHWG